MTHKYEIFLGFSPRYVKKIARDTNEKLSFLNEATRQKTKQKYKPLLYI